MHPAANFIFPSLETERLVLHPLAAGHTDFVFRHLGNPAVSRYLLDEPPLTDYSQAEEIVNFYADAAGKTYNRWVLVQKSDQQPIGTCGYHKWDRRNLHAEIGYDLDPNCWGQAYMSEALRAVIAFGFEKMALNRIEALVYVENQRSTRLLHSLGFVQEGLLREYFCLDAQYYDHYLYALLRKECKFEAH